MALYRASQQKQRGFTLIELLVVIAVIAVLLSLLWPSLGFARESARRVKCAMGLRVIGTNFKYYAMDNDGWIMEDQSQAIGPPSHWLSSGVGLGSLGLLALAYPQTTGEVYWCPDSENVSLGSDGFLGYDNVKYGWESFVDHDGLTNTSFGYGIASYSRAGVNMAGAVNSNITRELESVYNAGKAIMVEHLAQHGDAVNAWYQDNHIDLVPVPAADAGTFGNLFLFNAAPFEYVYKR